MGSRADVGEIHDPDAVERAAHLLAFGTLRLAFALVGRRRTPLEELRVLVATVTPLSCLYGC
jgi:hypothetical protein